MVISAPVTPHRPTTEQLHQAIAASREFLLSEQYPEGYWWSELESNVTLTAEVIILHKILGTAEQRPLAKAKNYLLQQQRDHGGWEIYYGDGGELSTSVEAYTALRILGVPAQRSGHGQSQELYCGPGGHQQIPHFHQNKPGFDWLLSMAGHPLHSPLDYALAQRFPLHHL